MRLSLLFIFIFSLADFQSVKANFGLQQFDRSEYYKVLKNGDSKDINKELDVIDASSIANKDAFKGALLMKKAHFADIPKQKLDYFKSGRIKLETAIKENGANVEFRFLRLIIQEHAPKIVKYSDEITGDASFIKQNFGKLPVEVQKIVKDYSQTSNVLKPGDL